MAMVFVETLDDEFRTLLLRIDKGTHRQDFIFRVVSSYELQTHESLISMLHLRVLLQHTSIDPLASRHR